MRGVEKSTVIQLGIVAIEGYFKFERVASVLATISISACYSFINRRCLDTQAKWGQNVPLSFNRANSIGTSK